MFLSLSCSFCCLQNRSSFRQHKSDYACFTGDVSAGYVFKRDANFKAVYGLGTVNVITADGCYYPWRHWGIGTKVGYWQANGHTSFFKGICCVSRSPRYFLPPCKKKSYLPVTRVCFIGRWIYMDARAQLSWQCASA